MDQWNPAGRFLAKKFHFRPRGEILDRLQARSMVTMEDFGHNMFGINSINHLLLNGLEEESYSDFDSFKNKIWFVISYCISPFLCFIIQLKNKHILKPQILLKVFFAHLFVAYSAAIFLKSALHSLQTFTIYCLFYVIVYSFVPNCSRTSRELSSEWKVAFIFPLLILNEE